MKDFQRERKEQMIHEMIPRPVSCENRDQTIVLPEEIRICSVFEDDALLAFLERSGLKRNDSSSYIIDIEKDDLLQKEEYHLTIEEKKICIKASSKKGVIWALTSLYLLIKKGEVPCCEIKDKPRHAHRGLLLDCCRHFFEVEEVKKIIEEMSLVKMNVLHWHLSDDQGFRIQSKSFPRLNEISKPYYTQEEIKEIVQYASLRGVDILPEIDLPGHTSAILAAYPEYSCFQEKTEVKSTGGIYPIILCPGKDETLKFVQELLEEIVPLFSYAYFHLGGDEAPKTNWKRCPDCQERMKKEGLSDENDLQAWFTIKAIETLKKNDKTPIVWNDLLEVKQPPKEITVQYWSLNYAASMNEYASSNGRFIYSDMFELYLDYPPAMTPLKKIYEIEPHISKFPCADNPSLLGIEACIWTEHIAEKEKLERMLFPRLLAVAEISWCQKRDGYRKFIERVETHKNNVPHSVSYDPKEHWDPKGSKRRKEALAYFREMNNGIEEVREQTVEASKPNKEFTSSFMNKFFKPWDMPFLLKELMKK